MRPHLASPARLAPRSRALRTCSPHLLSAPALRTCSPHLLSAPALRTCCDLQKGAPSSVLLFLERRRLPRGALSNLQHPQRDRGVDGALAGGREHPAEAANTGGRPVGDRVWELIWAAPNHPEARQSQVSKSMKFEEPTELAWGTVMG